MMTVTAGLGYITTLSLGALNFPGDFISACGSFVVGLSANLYSRFTHKPAVVYLLGGVMLLLPGSVGVKGVTAMMSDDVISGIQFTFQMFVTAMCITIGQFIAHVVVFPTHGRYAIELVVF